MSLHQLACNSSRYKSFYMLRTLSFCKPSLPRLISSTNMEEDHGFWSSVKLNKNNRIDFGQVWSYTKIIELLSNCKRSRLTPFRISTDASCSINNLTISNCLCWMARNRQVSSLCTNNNNKQKSYMWNSNFERFTRKPAHVHSTKQCWFRCPPLVFLQWIL